MGLHKFAGGLRMRPPWQEECAGCGFVTKVGMHALAWQSSMIPVCRGSKALMPASPALEKVITQAEEVRKGERQPGHCTTALDLAVAWGNCASETRRQYLSELDWREPTHPAHWMHVTQGSVAEMVHMPVRAQKALRLASTAAPVQRARSETMRSLPSNR